MPIRGGTSDVAPDPTGVRAALAGHEVRRVGFGAARLTAGDGWGRLADPEPARRLLRDALDAGYDLVDTADSLGPGVSEQIVGEVVGDRDDVLVATKVGMLRPAPGRWGILGHPDYLRQQVHTSLLRLRRERIDLLYLHRIDPAHPVADQLGALQELCDAGHIGAIGVSEPSAEQLDEVLAIERVAAVQSLFNVAATGNAPIVRRLAAEGIPFVAYWPLIGRGLPRDVYERVFAVLARAGDELDASPARVGLAWILAQAPTTFAVAGSRDPAHLADNLRADELVLDPARADRLAADVANALDGFTFDPRYDREHER
ncbi:aryl-alcohol dehydrogenase-like predicted oxidoreductase [Pseudoclavibacter chungangensis]|uniref:aldo/keto reductase n=1 Tax=Pseudoclavibacter chungangensis TaxID=587635 RepID=UPI0015CB3971|nr:aldo/keto reductase [Pseudoclavibacter chungangensis]NYJ65446.1 aryl-alcohol dehydrogenase-like predicted oxidoreductase [Pseudoclavibacter chungangensis]